MELYGFYPFIDHHHGIIFRLIMIIVDFVYHSLKHYIRMSANICHGMVPFKQIPTERDIESIIVFTFSQKLATQATSVLRKII